MGDNADGNDDNVLVVGLVCDDNDNYNDKDDTLITTMTMMVKIMMMAMMKVTAAMMKMTLTISEGVEKLSARLVNTSTSMGRKVVTSDL